MSDYTRRMISVLLLVCLCTVFAALPVCAAEVTRPAVTREETKELVEPDESMLGVYGGPDEDTRKGAADSRQNGSRYNGAPNDGIPDDGMADDGMPINDAPTDRMPGEYEADENGAVAGATDEAAWTNWVVWGVVIALLVAAAIVAGVVFLVPAKDED